MDSWFSKYDRTNMMMPGLNFFQLPGSALAWGAWQPASPLVSLLALPTLGCLRTPNSSSFQSSCEDIVQPECFKIFECAEICFLGAQKCFANRLTSQKVGLSFQLTHPSTFQKVGGSARVLHASYLVAREHFPVHQKS